MKGLAMAQWINLNWNDISVVVAMSIYKKLALSSHHFTAGWLADSYKSEYQNF